MGEHFALDVDGEQVRGAARGLGELGHHVSSRGHGVSSAPGAWASGWEGQASTAAGEEAAALGGHLTGFARHLAHAAAALTELGGHLRSTETVDLPDLNRRWAAADDAYHQGISLAEKSYHHAVGAVEPGTTPQVRRMIVTELGESRSGQVSAVAADRAAARTGLEVEFADLRSRLRQHAESVGAVLGDAVAVPVPPAVVAAYRAAQGNRLGRLLWDWGGSTLTELTTDAQHALGGSLEHLREQLEHPPEDYAQVQALLARARELGVPPAQYAPTLQSYWQHRAAEAAGIDLSTWDPAQGAEHNRATIEAVYRYYGNLYLADPDLQWAGMADMIGPSFAAGFFDLDQIRGFAQTLGGLPAQVTTPVPGSMKLVAEMTAEDLRFYETSFLDMQRQIFLDQGSMHQAYADGGMAAVEEMQQAGLIDQSVLDGWRDIDSGDPVRVRRGNEVFLLREQRDIIDDDYQRMYDHSPTGPAMTWAMTQIGEPSIPGAQGYADVFPLHVVIETPGPEDLSTPHSVFGQQIPSVTVDNPTQVRVDVTTPFASGNIADFDDRWALIQQDTLPAFQKLLAEDPQRAHDIIASDIHDRIADQRLVHHIDDILLQLADGDIDVDQ